MDGEQYSENYQNLWGMVNQGPGGTIINFGAPIPPNNIIPLSMIDRNSQRLVNLYPNPNSGKNSFRFLQVSTDEVYGSLSPRDPPCDENRALAPNSPYAASKAAGDQFVRAFYQTYGVPTQVARCCNNYGPYQYPEKLIPLVILSALREQPLPIYGDGNQIRDWLYVRDHCLALTRIVEKCVGAVHRRILP